MEIPTEVNKIQVFLTWTLCPGKFLLWKNFTGFHSMYSYLPNYCSKEDFGKKVEALRLTLEIWKFK
jgi:hypothetical protein